MSKCVTVHQFKPKKEKHRKKDSLQEYIKKNFRGETCWLTLKACQTSRSVDALNQRSALLHYFSAPHQGTNGTVSYMRMYDGRSTSVASVLDDTEVAPRMELVSAVAEFLGCFKLSCNSNWNKSLFWPEPRSFKDIGNEGKGLGVLVPKIKSAIYVPVR